MIIMSKVLKTPLKVFALLTIFFLNNCSNAGVQPWEKNILAKPEMALDSDPLVNALDDHIYFSKEASSGGRSFAGGGCGCN